MDRDYCDLAGPNTSATPSREVGHSNSNANIHCNETPSQGLGPEWQPSEAGMQDDQQRCRVEVINTIGLAANSESVTKRSCDVVFISEHAVPEDRKRGITAEFRKCGWEIEMSCLTPEARCNSGGVAIAVRRPRKLTHYNIRTLEFKQACTTGRAMARWVDIGAGRQALVFVVYGATNAGRDRRAAQTTNAVLAAVQSEASLHANTLIMVGGDLNGDIGTLSELATMTATGGWTDIGGCASEWGGHRPTPDMSC